MNYAVINKEVGETPLAALERYRLANPELKDVSMTYAGRLDPMAEGELLILIGDECHKKEKYLGLDKEYEVEIVFGIETDTYDALGLVQGGGYNGGENNGGAEDWRDFEEGLGSAISSLTPSDKKVVTFIQQYPPYSSKTVNGVQLHALARAGELPEEMPTKEVKIYELEVLNRGEISAKELEKVILDKISLVEGDFRQEEIKNLWKATLEDKEKEEEENKEMKMAYPIIKLRVKCSSGTYMRSLANRMGQELGTGAFALSINRTKIFLGNI